ncbi:MAG TPA: DNA polymerase III subunit epsilon [Alphaproteobacteria bacterium]|jgi:DNA polymerase-3 subunit epsilon|nr:DNA polymerase III subunit epsilon [Alphaproteobacteria bacterium]
MREIILDTETTGLDPDKGDRVIEIACVELINYLPTGQYIQYYLNPERTVPPDAVAIHGLTTEFLLDKPKFIQIADRFLDFIGNAPLVIHNAEFDIRFINAELTRIRKDTIQLTRSIDTVLMARQKFPGAPANLDALCRRFNIDISRRDKHGALLDCQLLSQVYLELRGGRQKGLSLDVSESSTKTLASNSPKKPFQRSLVIQPSDRELKDHQEMLRKLQKPLWEQG